MWTGHLRRQFDVISPSTNNPKIIQYSCCRSKYVVPNTANVLLFASTTIWSARKCNT